MSKGFRYFIYLCLLLGAAGFYYRGEMGFNSAAGPGISGGPMELMRERTSLFQKRHYQSLTGLASMDYYILKPSDYNPQHKYPLVVALHGASGHAWGAYVLSLPPMQQAYPAFVLVPRAKFVGSWENAGYSMGGFGTFGMVAEYPELFAAAAPLCGGGEGKDAVKMIRTPLWAFHGTQDDNIPVKESRDMTQAIKWAGGKQVYFTEFPTLGHNVWNQVYQSPEFWNWMFNQRRGGNRI
jgi:predicted peptidase